MAFYLTRDTSITSARFITAASALLLASCAPSNQLGTAKAELVHAQNALTGTKGVCKNGPTEGPYVPTPLTEGEKVRAEWDIAAAESLNDIQPQQEWEIRKSLGAEMGLAPSEVNGWRDIYKSRAEQAQHKLSAAKPPSPSEVANYKARIRQQACADVAGLGLNVTSKSTVVAALEESDARWKAWFTLSIIALASLIAYGVHLVRKTSANKNKARQETLQQISLDGKLRLAEIYFHKLTAAERDEILSAHAAKNLTQLDVLIERSANIPSTSAPSRPARRPLVK